MIYDNIVCFQIDVSLPLSFRVGMDLRSRTTLELKGTFFLHHLWGSGKVLSTYIFKKKKIFYVMPRENFLKG